MRFFGKWKRVGHEGDNQIENTKWKSVVVRPIIYGHWTRLCWRWCEVLSLGWCRRFIAFVCFCVVFLWLFGLTQLPANKIHIYKQNTKNGKNKEKSRAARKQWTGLVCVSVEDHFIKMPVIVHCLFPIPRITSSFRVSARLHNCALILPSPTVDEISCHGQTPIYLI